MVQLQPTILVQVYSSRGQSSSDGSGEGMRVEVRTIVNDGGTKIASQTVMSRGADGQYTVAMRAGMQTAVAPHPSERTIGSRIDRYA